MHQAERREPPSLARMVAGLALDYVRWTQLVPMILAWAFLLLMVGAMLLVNFQQQSFGLIERGIALYERVAGPVEDVPMPPDGTIESPGSDSSPVPSETGAAQAAVTFTGEDLESLALKAWALMALAGWLLGMAFRLLFGRRPRVGLKRKLLVTGGACLGCTGLFLFAYSFGSERFDDPFAAWLAMFVGIPLAVWCISAYSLAISALVDLAKKVIYGGGRAPSEA